MSRVEISVPLHPAQFEIVTSPGRFKVIAAGRRFGKTLLCSMICVQAAAEGKRVWWLAPSFPQAMVAWREIEKIGRSLPNTKIYKRDYLCEFDNGGSIQIKSALNPDRLRGEGLDLAVLDEAAFMRSEVWENTIRPALSDRLGKALIISSPNGKNWFYHLWLLGKRDESRGNDHGYRSFHFATSANPFIAPSEIEQARLSMVERRFQQEYLANFVEGSGMVFTPPPGCETLRDAATAQLQTQPIEYHKYVFGVDWGRTEDWTVISVFDESLQELVYLERLQKIDYHLQRQFLIALAARFRPHTIVVELNSIGGPNFEELQRDRYLSQVCRRVVGFMSTSASKIEAIEDLALAIKSGNLRFIDEPVLLDELESFEVTISNNGRSIYGSPQGLHDDCVMSLAIGWQYAKKDRMDLLQSVPVSIEEPTTWTMSTRVSPGKSKTLVANLGNIQIFR